MTISFKVSEKTKQEMIEHFKDLDSVLSKISEITKEGGIFAFATPSGEGISAKSNLDHFYTISPISS